VDMTVRGYMRQQMVKRGAIITFVGNWKPKIQESSGAVRARFQECAVLALTRQLLEVGKIITFVYHIHRLSISPGRQVGRFPLRSAVKGGKLAFCGVRMVMGGMTITCVPLKLITCQTQSSQEISNGVAPLIHMDIMIVYL